MPLLTLGIPTSATAAILLAAFQNYGIQPGPLLFQTQGALVWGLIASMYIGNILLLILNLPLIGLWVKVLTIPRPLLYAGILVFATLGAYSLHQSVVDLVTLYVFGLLGFMMRRWGFPVAPAVIGLILGPLAESQFRRALGDQPGRSCRCSSRIRSRPRCWRSPPRWCSFRGSCALCASGEAALRRERRTANQRASGARERSCRSLRAASRAVAALAVALAGAAVCTWHRTLPLPWLIGPLVAVALASMAARAARRAAGGASARDNGRSVSRSDCTSRPTCCAKSCGSRPGSHWRSCSRSCSVRPAAGCWRARPAPTSPTSFFAMAIGGASEMAAQAQRHGGRVDRVAAAHSLRIMLVVLIVPLLFSWLDVHGLDPYTPLARVFDPVGFAVLIAVTLGAAVAMERFGSPNSWMIGPLLAAAVITATGHTFSALPVAVVNAGQLLIGISLGTHFTPEFFRAAPRFLATVALITLGYLVAAATFGFVLAKGSGLHWSTAVVATTPGGIGEMALTAQGTAARRTDRDGVSCDPHGRGGAERRRDLCRVASLGYTEDACRLNCDR